MWLWFLKHMRRNIFRIDWISSIAQEETVGNCKLCGCWWSGFVWFNRFFEGFRMSSFFQSRCTRIFPTTTQFLRAEKLSKKQKNNKFDSGVVWYFNIYRDSIKHVHCRNSHFVGNFNKIDIEGWCGVLFLSHIKKLFKCR